MKRLMVLMTALICLFVTVANAAVSQFPQQLQVIEDEAFMGDLSLQNEIQLPEGLTTIGNRAFMNSSVGRVYLPESLAEIGENAFPAGTVGYGQDNTYAARYFDDDPSLIFERAVYTVKNLTRVDDMFAITVTSDTDSILRLDIMAEGSDTPNLTLKQNIKAKTSDKEVILKLRSGQSLPRYFWMQAWLETTDGLRVSETVTAMQYTLAYQQFESQDPEEFDPGKTFTFGDSGFAVAAEGVLSLDGEEKGNGKYTFTRPSSSQLALFNGERLLITTTDGNIRPVKIRTFSTSENGDTITYTVYSSSDLYLGDFFDVIRIDGNYPLTAAEGGVLNPDSSVRKSRSEFGTDLAKVTIDAEFGKYATVKVAGEAGLSFKFKMVYNKAAFGDNYFEYESSIEANVSLKTTVSAGFSTSDLDHPPEIVIFPEATIAGVPILATMKTKVSIPLEFELKGEGEFSLDYTAKLGESYNTYDGQKSISEKDVKPEVKLKAEFSAKIGLKAQIKGELLGGIVSADCSANFGVELKGTAGTGNLAETDVKKKHACDLCVDGALEVFFKIDAGIKCELKDLFKANLAKVTLLSIKLPVGDFYISVVNDPESLFKGRLTFGWQDCPNYQYKTTVQTQTADGKSLPGKEVTVLRGKDEKGSGPSPLATWLYPGDYTASVVFDWTTKEEPFSVADQARTIIVKDAETHAVHFEPMGGEPQPENVRVAHGEGLKVFPTVTYGNAGLTGWNTEEDGSGINQLATTPVTEDITLYAQWDEASHVTGKVTNTVDNSAMHQVPVTVTRNDDGAVILQIYSDEAGEFAFDLALGTYTVTASYPGFEDDEVILNINKISASHSIGFKMEPMSTMLKPFALCHAKVQTSPISMSAITYDDAILFSMGYGFSVGNTATVSYNLDGRYSHFAYSIGYVSGTSQNAKMTVKVDGSPVYEEVEIACQDVAKRFDIPTGGAKKLDIVLQYGGYDTVNYAIAGIDAPGVSDGQVHKSDTDFNATCYFKQYTEVVTGKFSMGGRRYRNGYKMSTGYGWDVGYTAKVSFNVEQFSGMTFDVARILSVPESSTQSGKLTVQLDGTTVAEYDSLEMKWNDLVKHVELNLAGVTQVTVQVYCNASDPVGWGLGDIHFTK